MDISVVIVRSHARKVLVDKIELVITVDKVDTSVVIVKNQKKKAVVVDVERVVVVVVVVVVVTEHAITVVKWDT